MNKNLDPDVDLWNSIQDWVDFNRECARATQHGPPYRWSQLTLWAWTKVAKRLRKLRKVRASDDMRRPGSFWGPSNESRRRPGGSWTPCRHARLSSSAAGRWCDDCGADA